MTPTAPECFHVRVRKCQECVRPGQSLASIATSLKADVLGLYLSNPFLQRPEDIKPGHTLQLPFPPRSCAPPCSFLQLLPPASHWICVLILCRCTEHAEWFLMAC